MAKEITIQQRVMEAGFGDMLEGHGFKKVGATHYKKEEDFGFWRVTMGKGFPQLVQGENFRDGTGFEVRGLEAIAKEYAKRVNDKSEVNIINRAGLPGTSVMVHWEHSVLWKLRYTDPGPKYPPPKPKPKGFWRYLIEPLERPSSEPFWDYHPDIEVVLANDAVWRLTQDRPFEAFVEELCGYWQRSFSEDVRRGAYLRAHQANWSRWMQDDDFLIDPDTAANCWLAGGQDLVREAFQRSAARFDCSDEELERRIMNIHAIAQRAVGLSPEEWKARAVGFRQDYRENYRCHKIFISVLEDLGG